MKAQMKTLATVCAASVAALALTVACSSKTKITDEPQADASTYQTAPDISSTSAPELTAPVAPEMPSTAIPDETAKVASLGASSSGRSR